MRIWALTFVLLLAPGVLCGQELTPEALVKLGTASWPTYNGDYSGQRHSPLDQINHVECGLFVIGLDVSRHQLRGRRVRFRYQVDAH